MKVWWCEEHESRMNPPLRSCEMWGPPWKAGKSCRMVEMRLVSVDAVVIEKVDGEWPEWAINQANEMSRTVSKYVLDDLASAQDGGE